MSEFARNHRVPIATVVAGTATLYSISRSAAGVEILKGAAKTAGLSLGVGLVSLLAPSAIPKYRELVENRFYRQREFEEYQIVAVCGISGTLSIASSTLMAANAVGPQAIGAYSSAVSVVFSAGLLLGPILASNFASLANREVNVLDFAIAEVCMGCVTGLMARIAGVGMVKSGFLGFCSTIGLLYKGIEHLIADRKEKKSQEAPIRLFRINPTRRL